MDRVLSPDQAEIENCPPSYKGKAVFDLLRDSQKIFTPFSSFSVRFSTMVASPAPHISRPPVYS